MQKRDKDQGTWIRIGIGLLAPHDRLRRGRWTLSTAAHATHAVTRFSFVLGLHALKAQVLGHGAVAACFIVASSRQGSAGSDWEQGIDSVLCLLLRLVRLVNCSAVIP